jgi:hypothetical protein
LGSAISFFKEAIVIEEQEYLKKMNRVAQKKKIE